MIEQKYVLENGKTITISYDEFGMCKVNKECMEVLLGRYEQDRADKREKIIDEYAHALKETFNNEFPSNYHCAKSYFTLDNVRALTDAVAKEIKEQK